MMTHANEASHPGGYLDWPSGRFENNNIVIIFSIFDILILGRGSTGKGGGGVPDPPPQD